MISTLLHKSCLWPTNRKMSSLTTVKTTKLKYYRKKYDSATGKFLGVEYCVALTTVNSPEEQFFDSGYVKANSKMLYSTRKSKIPSSLKATTFGYHKNQ